MNKLNIANEHNTRLQRISPCSIQYFISISFYFYIHHVLPLYMFLLQESGLVAELIFYARGLVHNDDITRTVHTNRQTCRNDDRCKDWRCDDCEHAVTISVIVAPGTARFADHVLRRFTMTRGLTFRRSRSVALRPHLGALRPRLWAL